MKTRKSALLILSVISILGAIAYGAWRNAVRQAGHAQGRKVICYQDSMHPWIKSDRPGKCTICVMDLTPIYEGDQGFQTGEDLVVLNTNSITVMNVQSEEVQRRTLSRTLRVAGKLEANEGRRAVLSAPAPGRIQSVAVDYAGIEVQANQPLVTILSAELIQKRAYIRAANVVDHGHTNDGSGMGMKPDPFSSVLVAPHAGTVIERAVAPGQYVLEGEKLLTIVDPSVLWFRFDIYQRELPWYEPGQQVEITVEGLPGRKFPGVISFIEPTLDDTTRTVKVRADIANPIVTTNGRPRRFLQFGMYAEGRVRADLEKVLAVPRSAILFPWGIAYAYVDKGNAAYERRRVKVGRQGDDFWEVLEGLEDGERIVTSGNVLIDAQAQFDRGGDAASGSETLASAEAGSSGPKAASLMPSAAGTDTHARPASGTALDPAQRTSLQGFLGVADGISRALAADSLDQLRPQVAALPKAVTALLKTFGGDHPWLDMFQRLEATADWGAFPNLTAARKTFLPFSTNVVELVQRLRSEEEAFRSLKVYCCPMAPKPGLWFQAKGPLRNPYFGAEMLMCGEEVRPPATRVQASPRMAMAVAKQAPAPADPPPSSASIVIAPTRVSSVPDAPEVAPESTAPELPDRRNRNRLQDAYARAAHTEEMRAKRWAAIAEANTPNPNATNGSSTNPPRRVLTGVLYEDLVRMPPPGSPAIPQTNAPMTLPPADSPKPVPGGAHTSAHTTESGLQTAPASMPASDEMTTAAAAASSQAQAAPSGPLTANQRQAVQVFLAEVDGISRALAGDDLRQFNQHVSRFPKVLPTLQSEVGTRPQWSRLLECALPLSGGPAPKELAAARKMFLPFSTATVELVTHLRKEEASFAGWKIYHCPMAPKPGLWVQAQGPLRNPFYGSEMLECGKEIKP